MNLNIQNIGSPTEIGKTNPDAANQKLYKAAKEMESLFLNQLLKSMRKTIPKNNFGDENALSGANSNEVYTQMFDQELASLMSGKGDRSIAAVLYRSLSRANDNQDLPMEIKSNLRYELPAQKQMPIINKKMPATEIKKPIKQILEVKPKSIDRIINRAADKYELDPKLIKSMIAVESGGYNNAQSSAGAKGLMQLMDTTATEMGVNDIYDPEENINGGSKYLRKMIDRFGSIKLGLAAYNAGPGNVNKYGGVPPFKETRQYVDRVMQMTKTSELANYKN